MFLWNMISVYNPSNNTISMSQRDISLVANEITINEHRSIGTAETIMI